MKLTKTEMFVLNTFIEDVTSEQEQSNLNIKGVKLMAKIQSKIASELLGINQKDIYERCEKILLKTIKYK